MSTHINASPGEIAEIVLLPGDPLRAKYIAINFLKEARPYNTVRNMLGYTGYTSDGKRVSVQGSGMGMPSLSIYTNELILDYGVQNIIRLGSCGGIQDHVKCRDVILAMGACSDSAMNTRRFGGLSFAPIANLDLLMAASEAARRLGIGVQIGNIFSTDTFYDEEPPAWQKLADYGVLGIEMETAELYTLAAKHKIKALTINTVSDNIVTGEHLGSDEREKTFSPMVELALAIV